MTLAVISVVLAFLVALTLVIMLYVLVMPKKKNGTFSGKFSQWLHDYFRFKKLYIESVLRFFFAFCTIFMICFGLFGTIAGIINNPDNALQTLLSGLSIMILGPIVLRLFYELTMMLIMLVQNVMDINKKLDKLPGKLTAAEPVPSKPAPKAAPAPAPAPAPSYATTPAFDISDFEPTVYEPVKPSNPAPAPNPFLGEEY